MRKLNLTALLAMTFIANVGYGMDLPDDAGATPAVTAGGTDGDDFVVIPRRRNRAQEARLAAEDALRATIVSAQINFFETPTERQGHYSVHFRALKEALSTPQYQEKLSQDTFVAMTVLLEKQSAHGMIGDMQTLAHINKAIELQKLFEAGINGKNQEQRRSERKWNFHLGRAISLYLQKLPELEEGEEDPELPQKQGLLAKAIELFEKSHENRGYPASKTPLLHAGQLLAAVFLADDEDSKSDRLQRAKLFLQRVCTPKASPTAKDEESTFVLPKTPPKLKRERSIDAVPEAKGDAFKNQAAKLLRDIEEALKKAEEDVDIDAADLPPPPPPVEDAFSRKKRRSPDSAAVAAPSGLRIDTNLSDAEAFGTPSSGRSSTPTTRKERGDLKQALESIEKTEADLPALITEYCSYRKLGRKLNIDPNYLKRVADGLDKTRIQDLSPKKLEELTTALRNKKNRTETRSLNEIASDFAVKEQQVTRRYQSILEEDQLLWSSLDASTQRDITSRLKDKEGDSVRDLVRELATEFNVRYSSLYKVLINKKKCSIAPSSSFEGAQESTSDDDDSDRE